MNDRKLRRKIIIGIAISDLTFLEKVSLFRSLRNDETWNKVKELILDAMAAAGMDIDSQEFDWSDFYEFLKWLLPLILELIGGL